MLRVSTTRHGSVLARKEDGRDIAAREEILIMQGESLFTCFSLSSLASGWVSHSSPIAENSRPPGRGPGCQGQTLILSDTGVRD